MKEVVCTFTGKACIHSDARPDDEVYDNCRLCDVFRSVDAYTAANAKEKRNSVKQTVSASGIRLNPNIIEIDALNAEWVKGWELKPPKHELFHGRSVYCSRCGRRGRIEWKGCPYCLAIMPAGIRLAEYELRKKESCDDN